MASLGRGPSFLEKDARRPMALVLCIFQVQALLSLSSES